jgi:hypothetical protein
VAVLPKASTAVTVKLNGIAAVAEAGVSTFNFAAAPGPTLIGFEAPVRAPAASVAVIVCATAVLSVTAKVPVPFGSAELAGGKTACVSVLEKVTLPE